MPLARRRCVLVLLPGLSAALSACGNFSNFSSKLWNTDQDASRFYTLAGDLSGASAVPLVRSDARGSVEAGFDRAQGDLRWMARFDGLTGPVTAVSLRGPALQGSVGPVLRTWERPGGSPVSGAVRLSQAEGTRLLAGLMYLDIATAAHPAGELRAQLAARVPAQ